MQTWHGYWQYSWKYRYDIAMLEILGYISGLFGLAAFIPYVRDTLRRTTKPERASWLIWSVLGFIAFFSQLAKGASHSLWLTGSQTIGVLVVFVLSWWYGEGGLNRRDRIFLALAGLGLVIWYFTDDATFALLMTIVVDLLAAILTIIKAYERPDTETMSTWVMAAIAGLFGTFAVGRVDAILLAYPVYVFIANIAIVLTIIYARSKSRANQQYRVRRLAHRNN